MGTQRERAKQHRDLIECTVCGQRFVVQPADRELPKHLHAAVPAVWCDGTTSEQVREVQKPPAHAARK